MRILVETGYSTCITLIFIRHWTVLRVKNVKENFVDIGTKVNRGNIYHPKKIKKEAQNKTI